MKKLRAQNLSRDFVLTFEYAGVAQLARAQPCQG